MVVWGAEGESRQIPGAHWASQASEERPCLKTKQQRRGVFEE